MNHGQIVASYWFCSIDPAHPPSSGPFAAYVAPVLTLLQFDGSRGGAGSVVTLVGVPFTPVLWYQQLFLLDGWLSHQKSSPFGIFLPLGAMPMMLSWKWLRCEVDSALSVLSDTASGTAISIAPRRQLSQKRLPRISLLLPPAIRRPVPTGTGTSGLTSESGV